MTRRGFLFVLQGFALILAVGLALGAPSPAQADLSTDGLGSMAVSGGPVVASSTGNTLTFTYAADPTSGVTAGTIDVAVPDGWTPPQTGDPNAAGYVTSTLATSDSLLDQAGIPSILPAGSGTAGTIHLTGVTLAPGDTLLISYGDVTAPAAGTYTFTTDESSGVDTPQPIATQPEVTVEPVTAPGAPSLTSATPGNGQVQLSWSPPAADGGGSITDYLINEYQGLDTSGTATVIDLGSTNTTTTVPGLTNGQPYTFTVQAVNSIGDGTPSPSRSAIPATVPGIPALDSATPGDGQAQLSWSAPADTGGAPIIDYLINEYVGGEASGTPKTIDTGSTGTSEAITGLTNGQQYTFTVQAINTAGTSLPSQQLSGTPRTVPSAPTLTATSGAGQVSLSWTAPSDGGAPIDHYVISEYAGSTPTGTPIAITNASTSRTITGLTNGSTYTFAVEAINAAGSSAASNAETAVPATVPTAPHLIATVAGSGLAEVVWTPPTDDGGAALSAYEIFRSSTAGSKGVQIANQAPGPSTNTYIDQTVTNGTTYYYEVVAVNRAGQSPASSQFSAEPQSFLPPPMLLSTLKVGSDKVTFSSPNKCIRTGRVSGTIAVSSTSARGTKVRIGSTVFRVGSLAKKTVSRRKASSAPIKVTLRLKHVVAKRSYRFSAQPSVAVGKAKPHVHTLRLKVTAC